MAQALAVRDRSGSSGSLNSWGRDPDFDGDEDGYLPVTRLREQYTGYLTTKVMEYEEQKEARHYYHAAQWTPDEIRVLRARRQPIITFNRTARKIDSIAGLVGRLRQDPKAYPRNPRNADGAEIATQALRAALDGMNFRYLDFECRRQAGVEGIAGIELKLVEGDHEDPDIGGDFIFGDDFFYDPTSFKPDFSDASFMGIAKWLHLDIAISLFPDQEQTLRDLINTGFDLTTHADREFKWVYANTQRLRLVEHWYRHRGRWYWAFYCDFTLLAEGVSPFLDERNKPMSRFVMMSAAVDHDGDRYGFCRNLKGPQDEMNQRRSKMLHLSNTNRYIGQKGAVDDVEEFRAQQARPDGYSEYNRGFDKPEKQEKTEDLAAQGELYQGAQAEIDSYANINPALMAQDDDHSGVAINMLQKAGIAEIASFIEYYRDWKLRVYRAVWNIIRRTWQSERWVRISGDDEAQRFLQLNGQELDQYGNPVLVNSIGGMNVEFILDEGPDTANMLVEAYETVKDDASVPWAVKLELMPIAPSVKKKIQQMMSQPPQPNPSDQIKLQTEQLKQQGTQAKTAADAHTAQVRAQAETFNAQQDQAQRAQEAHTQAAKDASAIALEREKMAADRERIHLEVVQARAEHEYKMEELRAQKAFRDSQREQQRKAAANRPKAKVA